MPSSACYLAPLHFLSFPTRRSSDLAGLALLLAVFALTRLAPLLITLLPDLLVALFPGFLLLFVRLRLHSIRLSFFASSLLALLAGRDRKSTRLNSSHVSISYAVFCLLPRPPPFSLFPYTTLFRSCRSCPAARRLCSYPARPPFDHLASRPPCRLVSRFPSLVCPPSTALHSAFLLCFQPSRPSRRQRSEEHTSELQSRFDLVCRLLLATSPPSIFSLSLHDALPILPVLPCCSPSLLLPGSPPF